MTDSRTTELLRKLLDENGIEWKSGRTNENNTSWDVGDLRVTAKELSDGTLLMYQYSRKHLTPEQVIAATLESERGKALEINLREMANKLGFNGVSTGDIAKLVTMLFEAADTIENMWDKLQTAELGSGTLMAEQVREAIYKNIGANSYNAEYYTSIIDHQAIADELNAELRSEKERNHNDSMVS